MINSIKFVGLSILISLAITSCSTKNEFKRAYYYEKYAPTMESLATINAQPEWFKDAKLGIYFHWGLYSVPAYQTEWYAKWMHIDKPTKPWQKGHYQYHLKTYGPISEFGYHHFKPMFKAEYYDPQQWLTLFKEAGAKFTGPVAQHHDGFALWKSKVNPNNAFDEGPKRDLAGEFLLEAKKQGFKTIATFHHSLTMDAIHQKTGMSTRYFPYSDTTFTSTNDPKLKWLYGNVSVEEYLPYWENIVYEVVDKYTPDMIWFDSGSRRIPDQNFLNVFAHHFNALASRNQQGLVFTKEKNRFKEIRTLDTEQGGLREMAADYWMTDITISTKGWCYIQNQKYKDTNLLIKNMIDVWSKRGVVLLNVSPTASGIINQDQQDRLKALGNWMNTFGEAVYNTRSHNIFGYGTAEHQKGSHAEQSATMKYTEEDIRFTKSKDGKSLYVFILGQPEEGEDLIIQHVLSNSTNNKIIDVTLLGVDEKVVWEYEENLKIKAPKHHSEHEIVTVFKVTFEEN